MHELSVIAARYKLTNLIGRGGMGEVYAGLDMQTDQSVAIKVLNLGSIRQESSMIERFEREADILRTLSHPNIVTVFETIRTTVQHYIVMEYVQGGSLADLMKQHPQLSLDRVLHIALDLADALTRAHRLGVVHRDIKPQNVLLAEDGTPRLTDFGVAHIGDRTRLTESGSLVGTYAYMSPEACYGHDLDERTDIWSFGVTLYEMLAGQRPFAGDYPGVVLTAILNQPVPDLHQFRPDVPAALVHLVMRMLEKDRDQRLSSVRLIGTEIEALLGGRSIAVNKDTPPITPAAHQLIAPPTAHADTQPTAHADTQPTAHATAYPTAHATAHHQMLFVPPKSHNPFGQTGRITDPTTFFGRDSLLRRIFEELQKGTSLSLVGERQSGKSSILAMVCLLGPARLNLPKEAFIYLNMQMIEDDQDFFEALCAEMDVPPMRGGKLVRALRGKRFIVCLDEIEKMADTTHFSGAEREQLRGLADGADAPFKLVIASSIPLDTLFPDSPGKTSPLANICLTLDVPLFDHTVARDFIHHRLQGTGIEFRASDIDDLLEQYEGNPAKLQRAAAELFDMYHNHVQKPDNT